MGGSVSLPVSRPKGGIMNRIEKKETAGDAAKLFKEEVRGLGPDIPRKELCDMVDDYIYYQTDDMSRKEADAIVEATCRLKDTPRETLPLKCLNIYTVGSFCNCIDDAEPVDVAARALCDRAKSGDKNITGDDLAELKKALMDME
jgi:hypothetical protein